MNEITTEKPTADEQPFSRLSNKHALDVLRRTDIIWSEPGSSRRSKLLAYLRDNIDGLPVNRKHQIRDTDPDIRSLLKKGHVQRVRVHASATRAQTYIRAAVTGE